MNPDSIIQSDHGRFLNSPQFAKFRQSMGEKTFIYQGALFIERNLPLGFGKYCLSSRADIDIDKKDFQDYLFVRSEPLSKAIEGNSTFAVQPRQTLISDLSKELELKSKHRYNLKLAKRNNLKIEIRKDAGRFYKLLTKTAKRQDFNLHSLDYYQKLNQLDNTYNIFVSFEGQDLSAMLLYTTDKTAIYLHGASSDEHKNLMAPYLMHETAWNLAREKKCTTYDWWGIDAVSDSGAVSGDAKNFKPKNGAKSAGTTRFKLGFGGYVVSYSGCFDVPIKPFWYTIYNLLRRITAKKRAFQ